MAVKTVLVAAELPGEGGTVGTGIGGKPVLLVLLVTGCQTRPPGPTTMEVGTPSMSVVIVVVPVNVES